MKRLGVLLWMCCVLWLAACGSQESDGFVTGKYYYPSQETKTTGVEQSANGGKSEAPGGANETTETQQTGTVMQQTGAETTEMESTEETEGAYETDLFLITSNDMQSECLILEQLASGKQYMYNYSITTRFMDKYGNHTNVSDFEPGRIICVGEKDVKGRLLEARISDTAWEYPGVKRYMVDEERGVFQIADTNYSFDEGLFVHSDGTRISVSDLSKMDTLRVVGIGKEILSVSVTTGHGELRLENTELFEGSFIHIGNKIFAEIVPNMSMEVPEGTYTVTVANNGYGGSKEVVIESGQETLLDLDTLKGEGPKRGSILFAVDVAGAEIRIDGKRIDYSAPVEVTYGVHNLEVTADSYEPYSKKLFVNSKEATIVIGLTGETTASGSSAQSSTADTNQSSEKTENSSGDTGSGNDNGQNPGGLAGSLAGSQAGTGTTDTSGSGNTTGAASEAEIDAIVDSLLGDDEDISSDYLSTITELLSSLSDTD